MAVVVEPSFALGELSDALSGRIDMEWYGKGLAKAVNFYVLPSGGATLRPGTEYVGQVPDMTKPSRLIPFVFNSTETYCLLFNNDRVYPMQDGGFVTSGGAVYSFAFEMSDTALPDFRVAQSADILYVTHQDYPVRKIMRYGNTDWRTETPTFMPNIKTPTGLSASTNHNTPSTESDSTVDYTYCVTAYNDSDESAQSSSVTITSRNLGLDNTQITLTWDTVAGATEYKVYKDSGGTFGLVGYADASNLVMISSSASSISVNGNTFTKDTAYLEVKVTTTTVSTGGDDNSESGNGSSSYETISTYTIKTGTYPSYISSSLNQRFVYCPSSKGGVWYLFNTLATGEQEPTASSSLWGSNSEYPQGTGASITIVPVITAGGYRVQWVDKNYEADVSTTPLTFENPFSSAGNYPACVGFIQQRLVFAGSKNNPQKIWMSRSGNFENFGRSNPTRDDDAIYISIYSRQVSWIRSLMSMRCLFVLTGGTEYTITGGSTDAVLTPSECKASQQSAYGSSSIEPVAVGNSIVMLQRGGSTVRDMAYDYTVDGYQGNDLSIRSSHLFHDHTITAWAYQTTPDGVLWAVRDDGILLSMTYNKEHQIFAWTRHETDGVVEDLCCVSGDTRDEVYMVVKRTINGAEKRYVERLAEPFRDLTSDTAKDAWYVDCGLKYSSTTAVTTLSGLGHLEGKTVAVLADGGPINGITVQDGKITLPRSYNTIIVGLPYEGLLKSLRVNGSDQHGPSQGRRQKIGDVILRFDRTVGGEIGWERFGTDGDVLEEKWSDIKYRTLQTATYASKPFSGDRNMKFPGGWDNRGQFMLRQTDPLPMTLLCAILNVTLGEK